MTWLKVPKNDLFQTLAEHINYFWKEDKDKTPYKTENVFSLLLIYSTQQIYYRNSIKSKRYVLSGSADLYTVTSITACTVQYKVHKC